MRVGRVNATEFLRLLDPLKESLARYAYRNAWNPADAADIVQHAVTVAWGDIGSFRRGTNFRAWIFKIMVHAIHHHNKRHRRDRAVADVAELELPDVSLAREEAWQSVLEEPERVFQSLDQRLVHALDALGADERQCLLLRLLERFSYREISEMQQLPLGTVMSHVHRARLKLRERLADLAIETGLVKEVPL